MSRLFYFLFVCIIAGSCHPVDGQKPVTYEKEKLIFAADFSGAFDTTQWHVETPPHPANNVYTRDNRLWLDTNDGITVWYKNPVPGNYCIEYNREVVLDSGSNDRLSDLNNFWQASDPNSSNLFTRNGGFESYDDLQLYYAGIGGNYNTTSRFRKYHGNSDKPVLQEYLDPGHLLEANFTYNITIIYKDGTTQLLVNDAVWFSHDDDHPLPAGYFGLRSTKSRQWVSEFRIWEIK